MTAVLSVTDISRQFGGLQALSDVAFTTVPGEIFGIIGPNGAGKTTLFNVITGAFPPSTGKVVFEGTPVAGLSMDKVARMGLVRTFQATSVFRSQSVFENLRRGAMFSLLGRPSFLLRAKATVTAGAVARKRAEEIIDFLDLGAVTTNRAGDLAYGLQKILGVGMALAAAPKMLLMDEPAAGLNPTETAALGKLLLRVRGEWKIDIVVVEHDMQMIMSICDRIMVLNYGRVICLDTPSQVRADPAVIEAYLGTDDELA